MFTKNLVDADKSPKAALMNERELAVQISKLRKHLEMDDSDEVKIALSDKLVSEALSFAWWQRIHIPGNSAFTTSDHKLLSISDPGFLNTLGNALTPEEGFILRPMPKWSYLKPVMPNMIGKSVLEIGPNNGFFCFEFAQMGASKVTGAEVFDGFIQPAKWMTKAKGLENVDFILTDAMLDFSLPAHDIVFMSEVYGHFVDPFFGILRAINLAKETLVIDNATMRTLDFEIDIGAGVDPLTGNLTYHAWLLSDGLLLTYLMLCGVPPERVTRYVAPWDNHIVYVIDTRDVENYRRANAFQPSNTSFITRVTEMGSPLRSPVLT